MAAIHDLINQIQDPALRAKIEQEVDKLTKQKKFGLVFEEHLPECTPLYDIPVRKGLKVSVRDGKANETYTVLKVTDGRAVCLPKDGAEAVEFDVADLVTTAELGDPIYPYLQPLGEVCNAPDSDLWHTLIEADNYHALQLLEYLYAGKVDCIYIDPPYNTGAKDWKYNNDYVDGTDEYRHSKWLSFMQKRLEIAKRLLNPNDSVLIVTPAIPVKPPVQIPQMPTEEPGIQTTIPGVYLDREAVTKFINEQGFLTYLVRSVKINSYLKSALSLSALLTQTNIYPQANDQIREDVAGMIRAYVDGLRSKGKYEELASKVLSFKLSVRIFDVFGEALDNGVVHDFFTASEGDLDRQLRAADAKLGNYGFQNVYGRKYFDPDDPNSFKIDCILFAADDDCIGKLNQYAERKFHELNDKYRKYIVNKSEKIKKQYSDIIADGDIVSKHNFALPETISVKLDADGKEYDNHLFADDSGISTIKLNNWEEGVLEEEANRTDFVCWIRNPSREKWSLCIPYEINGETKGMYPDFLIVRSDPQLDYIVDILEPHADNYKDNLPKAKGLAAYARDEQRIGRVQLIRMGKDAAGKSRFKRLDLSLGHIRDKVLHAVTNDELDHIFDTEGFFA